MHLRLATFAVALAALGTIFSPAAMALRDAAPAPVVKQRDARFGNVLGRRDHQALYFWNIEKRDFKIHCTGNCAVVWPPLTVRSATAVPRRIAGISGTFGTIRRPDGRLQVTRNRLPLYTYAHEGPNQVLCNDVDGWFVVRV